jgi:hypothetical protein
MDILFKNKFSIVGKNNKTRAKTAIMPTLLLINCKLPPSVLTASLIAPPTIGIALLNVNFIVRDVTLSAESDKLVWYDIIVIMTVNTNSRINVNVFLIKLDIPLK